MYCTHCGKEIADDAQFCTFCGAPVDGNTQEKTTQESVNNDQAYYQSQGYQSSVQTKNPDSASVGFTILSFFIPIVGIVLYFVWKNQCPNKAKPCLYAALISIVINFIVLRMNSGFMLINYFL